MSAFAAQASGMLPEFCTTCRRNNCAEIRSSASSNIFSLGAIFYEMVTERKAFDGEDADQVRQSISEMTPVAPDQINRKIHPALSQVIMKALSKAPEERYQSGQDLVNDLERCKESATKAAAAAKPGQPAAEGARSAESCASREHANRETGGADPQRSLRQTERQPAARVSAPAPLSTRSKRGYARRSAPRRSRSGRTQRRRRHSRQRAHHAKPGSGRAGRQSTLKPALRRSPSNRSRLHPQPCRRRDCRTRSGSSERSMSIR